MDEVRDERSFAPDGIACASEGEKPTAETRLESAGNILINGASGRGQMRNWVLLDWAPG